MTLKEFYILRLHMLQILVQATLDLLDHLYGAGQIHGVELDSVQALLWSNLYHLL